MLYSNTTIPVFIIIETQDLSPIPAIFIQIKPKLKEKKKWSFTYQLFYQKKKLYKNPHLIHPSPLHTKTIYDNLRIYSNQRPNSLLTFSPPNRPSSWLRKFRQIQSWLDTPGKWMNYYKKIPETNQLFLCNIENFTLPSPPPLPYNTFIHELVNGLRTMDLLKQLTGRAPTSCLRKKDQCQINQAAKGLKALSGCTGH